MRNFRLFIPILATVFLLGGCDEFFPSKSAIDTLSLSPTNRFMKVGDTQQFTATAKTVGGTSSDVTSTATWTTSDSSVASLSQTTKGLVTAAGSGSGVGTATITASSGGISTTAAITVTNSTLSTISISPTNPTTTVGNTVQLTATGTFADNSTQNITNRVTWATSDSSKATVSATGLVSGVASTSNGTVTITATAQTNSAAVTKSVDVTVQ